MDQPFEPQDDGTRRYRVEVSPGLELCVTEWGVRDGVPVLILHGGSHDASHWADVCRRLPTELRCLVPDQRGHGASDRAPDGDYSCEAQVADVVALLDALEVERCAVVGHSMGGLNALHFAGRFPERVTALALVDVGTETRESGLAAIRRSRERGARVPSSDPSSEPPADPSSAPSTEPPPAPAAPLPAPAGPPFDVRLLDFVPTFGGSAEERRQLLRESAAPLLVMRGAKSKINSAESAARTAEIGNGEVATIPNAGHNVSLHNPAAVAAELQRFLLPVLVDTAGRDKGG